MAKQTDEQKENLRKNLIELNSRLGYTIKYISTQTGIPERSYESYLYDGKIPRKDRLDKLAEFYNTTSDILLSSNMVVAEIEKQNLLRQCPSVANQKTVTTFDTITEILAKLLPQGKQFTLLINLIQQFGYNVIYLPTFTADEINAFSSQREGVQINKEKTYNKQMIQRASAHMDTTKANSETLEKIQAFMASKKDILDSLQSFCVDQRLSCELFIEKYHNGDFDDIKATDIPIEIRLQHYKGENALKNATSIEDLDYYSEDYPLSKFIELLDGELEDFIMGFLENTQN